MSKIDLYLVGDEDRLNAVRKYLDRILGELVESYHIVGYQWGEIQK